MELKRIPKPSFLMRSAMPTYRRRLLHGRTANFNSNEKRVLVQLVDPYKDVVDSKRNDVSTVKEKENIWNHLTRLFNSKFPDQKPREARNLQRLWKNIKSKAKAQNTEIETMLDSEAPRVLGLPQIKIELDSDHTVGSGFQETDGQESSGSDTAAGLSLSTESQEKQSEVFNSFRRIAPKPSMELPTLVHMGTGNGERAELCPPTQNDEINSTKHISVSEEAVVSSFRNSDTGIDTLSEISVTADEYKKNDRFANDSTQEMQFESESFTVRSGYDENVLIMKQQEHEQKMKNLRHEREQKREEHALRMDLLKEEMELVRLRKELLKRQLDSYISTINA